MKIYRLRHDPAYQWVTTINDEEFQKFNQVFDEYHGKNMGIFWDPPKLKIVDDDENKPKSDFPGFLPDFPIFSRRAKELLKNIVAPFGEFLPFISDFGEYYGFNVQRCIDALDEAKSVVKRFRDGRIMQIEQHAFYPHLVRNEVIFTIPQGGNIYVTDIFVSKVEEHGLTGLDLREVWHSD